MPDNLNYRMLMKYNDEMKKLVQANEREPFGQGQMEEEKVYAVKKKIFRGNKIVLNQTGVKKNEIAQWACVAWRWLSSLENLQAFKLDRNGLGSRNTNDWVFIFLLGLFDCKNYKLVNCSMNNLYRSKSSSSSLSLLLWWLEVWYCWLWRFES